MNVVEYYDGEGRKKIWFRFDEKDIKIVVEGQKEYVTNTEFSECVKKFYKEYKYSDIVEAFRDFLVLTERGWTEVKLQIESRAEPELKITFDNRLYFVADFIVAFNDLCKDLEKLKLVSEKIEEIREILQR